MTQPNEPARCPMTGQTAQNDTDALTRREPEPGALTDYAAAREVLRDREARQAGFLVDTASAGLKGPAPVLYMQGKRHTEMRRATARYFTPAAVEGYRPMIARLSDDLIAELLQRGEANLDDLSLRLAVEVASRVVGLTNSRLPGMERRIEAFVSGDIDSAPGQTRLTPLRGRRMMTNTALFFALDVKPAITARRREPREDLISYLLSQDYDDAGILSECLTYATAGMVTTREFISLAAYQMLTRPALREEYVHGTEPERHALLHELLRLDPVVARLYRRLPEDAELGGVHHPAGSVLTVDVQRANADPAAMGDGSERICPGRAVSANVQPPGLSFGDGPHRCPGAFLAIKESDIFLRRLLVWRDLRLVRHPRIARNELVKGYELRGLRVSLGR